MTLETFIETLLKYHNDRRKDWTVVVETHEPSIGPSPCSVVRSVIDWDAGKIVIRTEDVLTKESYVFKDSK